MSYRMRLVFVMILSLLLFSGQVMAVEPGCIDNDGDGYDSGFDQYSSAFNQYSTLCTWSDCDDNDPNINPGAAEICGNGIDENCNGNFDDLCPPIDNDGDGYADNVDCNDNDPNINPGASEVCGNGIDENCNGPLDDLCPLNCADYDLDGDGFYGFNPYSSQCFPGDCDDSDPFINPDATEVCDDTRDNNCNGLIDCQDTVCETNPVCISCTDADGDGYAIEGLDCGPIDCNDSDAGINPGAVEACSDNADNDCDGQIDCADGNCTGSPACPVCIPEVCGDGIDNDCDGKADCSDKSDCRNDPFCSRGSEGNGKTCSDGIDNDGDSAIDCADADCSNNRSCR